MTNPKPNNVFAERDALQRENERLKQQVKDANADFFELDRKAIDVFHTVNDENKRLRAELEAARKVADAAVHYFNVDTDRADWDALAFNALDDAVREYRARAESNGKENGE